MTSSSTPTNTSVFSMMIFLCLTLQGMAQETNLRNHAKVYLEQNYDRWQLKPEDVAEIEVSDLYSTRHNGITHAYFRQSRFGIGVHNALAGIHLNPEGQVLYATSSFVADLDQKINTAVPVLSSGQAVLAALDELGLEHNGRITRTGKEVDRTIFDVPDVADEPIEVRLRYQPLPALEQVRLAWDLAVDVKGRADHWSLRVDAVTGEILQKNNYTLYCSFPGGTEHIHGLHCRPEARFEPLVAQMPAPSPGGNGSNTNGPVYEVFPIPVESPIHGARELLADPSDPVASPFGWHDTNGREGAEYTITRGNNVHAYLDASGLDAPQGDEPDGGDSLVFNFPFDPDAEPAANEQAAVVQLFYMNNVMHDFAYHYGFDEAAGNFQQNTYMNGGSGGDAVQAHAQDGSGTNNANFSTPPDGGAGTMQMFLWDIGGSGLLEVIEPEGLATRFETESATFGPPITDEPVEGFIVEAFDGSESPDLGCETIVNEAEVAGNIAMINRGECFFEEKTLNVEEAGAIAAIICNSEETLLGGGLGGRNDLDDPSIPTIMLKKSDCQRIRLFLKSGVRARLQRPSLSGPRELDATFDNGIVAHEYGHGISLRLTGGPSDAECLFNDEQMGEGWSDFFTLVLTARPEVEDGTEPKGIGNYVIRGGANGGGIRRAPYSTDMQINNQSYDDIINTFGPHELGEVWAAVLWDLYWEFVRVYGWDDDRYTGDGGNNMAVKIVIDAMKLQKCNPGFVEARNAIIAADLINFDGANECLIWEVFARRGLGWSADEGGSFSRNDGLPGFDLRPDCSKRLEVTKTVTDVIEAGEELEVRLVVNNYKDERVSGVVITEEIEPGTRFLPSTLFSVDNPVVEQVDGEVRFLVDEIAAGDEVKITYRLETDPARRSIRQFYDDVEEDANLWEVIDLDERGDETWEIEAGVSNSGDRHWFIATSTANNDKALQLREPLLVEGAQPVMRFYHKYLTEPKNDGGIIQISADGGGIWQEADDLIFRNGYRGRMTYSTFSIPDIDGFWGRSPQFEATYIDLSSFLGQEILIRFRFGTIRDFDEEGDGWRIDDVELLDLFNYLSETCVSSEQGDLDCAVAEGRGAVVEPGADVTTSTTGEFLHGEVALSLYPNPNNGEVVNLSLKSPLAENVLIQVLGADGRKIREQRLSTNGGTLLVPLQTASLDAGVYIVEATSESNAFTVREKLLVIR